MSKLLKTVLIGACAGTAVGALAHVALAKNEMGERKPLPSAITAALAGLAPLGNAAIQIGLGQLHQLLDTLHDAAGANDYANAMRAESPDAGASATGSPAGAPAQDPLATSGDAPSHPAGPGFAPTPA